MLTREAREKLGKEALNDKLTKVLSSLARVGLVLLFDQVKRQSRRGSSIRAIESIVVLKQEVRWTLKEGVFFFTMN